MTTPRPSQARDLAEFYQTWPSHRGAMVALRDSQTLSREERANLGWLIHLADQVGPRDLQPAPGEEPPR